MSLQRSAILRAGAPIPELTARTGLRGSLVLVVVSTLVVAPSFQEFSCRTGKGVGIGVIGKDLFGEDPFLPA